MSRYAVILLALACAACTEIITVYPICERTTWNPIIVDTLAVPDSTCIAEFKERTK
jgi:hypothetical protein